VAILDCVLERKISSYTPVDLIIWEI